VDESAKPTAATADGYQNIGLWVVRGSAPAGDRLWNDREAGRLADLSFKVTAYVHDLTGSEVSLPPYQADLKTELDEVSST
jgi:hypothetical protein